MAIRYSLEREPEARNDGSGYISHDIKAQEDGSGDWVEVPGYHKDIMVNAVELSAVLDMANGGAKVSAYKSLLIDSRNNVASPDQAPAVTDWSKAGIETYLVDYAEWLTRFNDTNSETAAVADNANEYITVTLDKDYPVPFNI